MTVLAEANQVKFSMFEEAEFGVIPTGDKLADIRIRSENLKQDTDSTQNDELRFDRQRGAPVRTGVRANGGFEFLFSYGSHDFLLEALLFSHKWTTPVDFVDSVIDVSVAAGTKTYTSVADLAFIPNVDEWVLFAGFSNSTNNGLKKVVSATSKTIVVEQTCVTEAAGASVKISRVNVIAAAETDVSVTAGTKTYSSVGGWDTIPMVGEFVKFAGFTEAANNGFKKVVSANANDIVVEQTCVTEGAAASVTITRGEGIENGATKRSFTAEANYNDLAAATAGKFRHHTGLIPNTAELSVQASGLVSGSFGFLGAREFSAAATVGDGSNTVVSTTQPMNAIDHVTAVLENGQSIDLSDFTLRLNNNLAERLRIGTLGAFDIRAGSIDVEGTLEGYYEDSVLIDKYLNWDDTSLVIQFQDFAGNQYLIEVPRCKFTDGTRNASGINTDIKTPLTWSAFAHENELKTVKWYRWAA